MLTLIPHIFQGCFSSVRSVLFCRRTGGICPLDGIHDKKPEKYVARAAHCPDHLVSHQTIAPQNGRYSHRESSIPIVIFRAISKEPLPDHFHLDKAARACSTQDCASASLRTNLYSVIAPFERMNTTFLLTKKHGFVSIFENV